jgi:hypothetical protein
MGVGVEIPEKITTDLSEGAGAMPYAVKAANVSKYHVSILWLACEARLVLPCVMLAAFK